MLQTANDLREAADDWLDGRRLVVVSNREPYVHARDAGGGVVCRVPAGGLVSALDPVMRACGGTWVAHGSGDADRVTADRYGRVDVPPDDPRYRLRRVWLPTDEAAGYYEGFANQGLWPLCHRAFVAPRFERGHWRDYQNVNRRFARAVLEECADDPSDAMVLVQDYHFALLPRLLKASRPGLAVGHFWHIPWPSHDALAVCPWADELLEGLLGNDLLGFHTPADCAAFLEAVDRRIEAIVDRGEGSVRRGGHRTLVRPFPISVDAAEIEREAAAPSTVVEAEGLRDELGLRGQLVGLGVDRFDYTKGIPERLEAIDRLLERRPEYRGRFTFLQLGPLSRAGVPAYRRLHDEIARLVDAVNAKHGTEGWTPVRLLAGDHDHRALLAYYRLADVCVVSSLHDGMNLVAKEFVAARPDGGGVLVLSAFTGAARELPDALPVNPFDLDGFADALRLGLEMPAVEKARRMARLRAAVAEKTVYDWAHGLIAELGRAATAECQRHPIELDAARLARRPGAERPTDADDRDDGSRPPGGGTARVGLPGPLPIAASARR
jgi:trehalose 6-phosphate synthase